MASSAGHSALSSYGSDFVIEFIEGKGLKFIEGCIILMEIFTSLFHKVKQLLLA